MTSYRTKQGDMWDEISQKVYGDCRHADVLIAANAQYVTVFRFSENVEIVCPDISETVGLSNLPPWKKVTG